MTASEIARLIIRIEETVNPDSEYYGKLVKWWEQEKELWHYGIGLSNTHFFNIGTIEAKELQILKRHDIIEQRDLDIRGNPGIYSPFESDEIIERLKYALRWLNDLPENSSKKKLNGKSLAFLIFTDDQSGTDQDGELIPREIEFESYLKQNSPQLKQSKIRDFFEKGRTWLYIFLFGFGLMLAFIGLIPGVESGNFLIKWGSRLLFVLVSTLVLAIIFVLISNFKWSGFQKKSFWDWLQLLIVPLMLAFGAFYLNYASETRDKQIAEEGKQQELLKDYFSKMQTLIVETKKSKESQPNPDRAPLLPEFQPIAQALTLAVLDELDGKRKGKVISYLADSKLITANIKDQKSKPVIDLRKANLKEIVLEDVSLDGLSITGADMTEAKLTEVILTNSNLVSSKFINATLDTVDFSGSKLGNSNFYDADLKNITRSEDSDFTMVCFRENQKINNKKVKEYFEPTINILLIQSAKSCKSPEKDLDKKPLENL
ncbi:pentapeptide repeat-containing protein [Microcystis aeruginosa]|uniref:Pentapeptide repeat-containing protein n=1 Tax=Microcystis aeruginosa PCC 9701 TaxID=721123 RepID=I4IWX9_MICAE|nr:pentapeptide repeat-containing protein [Microcystis aeruginosa]CCI38803.1 membrane hypothetical protein [Microcystis aeruginosa PCC 9701]